MSRLQVLTLLALLAGWSVVSEVRADTFGSGANSFSIEFVTIGDPGNPADTTGSPNPVGSVPYAYRIGKFEISEQMIDKANALGGLGLTIDARGPDKPATSVSWFEAARFVNWLNTSTGNAPAYKFDAMGEFQLWSPSDAGYDANNLFRNSLAKYSLPSADEWYKAAYYDPLGSSYWNYPTGSNSLPVAVANGTMPGTAVVDQVVNGPADIALAGGLSDYGTMAQGGNVSEWEETSLDLLNDMTGESRGIRGAGWGASPSALNSELRSGSPALSEGPGGGFRVASTIPEPQAVILLAFALLARFAFRAR
jgi:formylglycine-generating enzyme required for sulfatase activity